MSTTSLDFTVGIIIDTSAEAEVISSIIGILPSSIIQTETGNRWVHKKLYKKQTDVNDCIHDYFKLIPDYTEKLKLVKQYGTCVFRLSVVSLLGQFGFCLSETDLQLLNELDIPLEITFFSYGQCIDDLNCN